MMPIFVLDKATRKARRSYARWRRKFDRGHKRRRRRIARYDKKYAIARQKIDNVHVKDNEEIPKKHASALEWASNNSDVASQAITWLQWQLEQIPFSRYRVKSFLRKLKRIYQWMKRKKSDWKSRRILNRFNRGMARMDKRTEGIKKMRMEREARLGEHSGFRNS